LGLVGSSIVIFRSLAWNLPSGESNEIVLTNPLQNQEYG
jgi:hypothetical protein